jgi:hypothetical protein
VRRRSVEGKKRKEEKGNDGHSSVSTKLENLSNEVLENGGEVDCGSQVQLLSLTRSKQKGLWRWGRKDGNAPAAVLVMRAAYDPFLRAVRTRATGN